MGSSPLTRGKLRRAVGRRMPTGLIPAHAGKTRFRSFRSVPCPAHPRSRGENPPGTPPRQTDHGSSPLTRGKHARRSGSMIGVRLIPAHAGKTDRLIEKGRHMPGSSPLTRGKRVDACRERGGVRLIPAHAGKTRRRRLGRSRGPAHPRSRGENDQGAPDHGWPVGSSPLTRGKPRCVEPALQDARLIPAHAGKTRGPRRGISRRRAHPRSRGENTCDMRVTGCVTGSSPLTRGKPV